MDSVAFMLNRLYLRRQSYPLSETLPYHQHTYPDIDPRLELFLLALAELIAWQILRETEKQNGTDRARGDGREILPQVD